MEERGSVYGEQLQRWFTVSILTANWIIGLLFVATVAVGGLSFFIGWLFSKTSKLGEQLNNHYNTITTKIGEMEGNVGTIEKGVKDMQKEIVGLRGDIKGYSKDMGEKIRRAIHEELQASQPNKQGSE